MIVSALRKNASSRNVLRIGRVSNRNFLKSCVARNSEEKKEVILRELDSQKTPTKTEEASRGGPKSKKGFSLFGFLFKGTIFATALYGGVLYLATKDDRLLDYVIEHEPPMYEELLELIENGSTKGLEEKLNINMVKDWSSYLFSKERIDELTQRIDITKEEIYDKTKKKFGSPTEEKQDDTHLPVQQLQKPVETNYKPIEHLPLVTLNENVSSSVDTTIKSTVQSFNDLIKSIDVGSSANGSRNETLIKTISENVSDLSNRLSKLTESFNEELLSKLKITQNELLSSFTKKEMEMNESLLDQYNKDKNLMEERLQARLINEIEITKANIRQESLNVITAMRKQQIKDFEKLVVEKIDRERDGRLKNLTLLNNRVEELENFSTSLENQLVTNHRKSMIMRTASKLKSLISGNSSAEVEKPQSLTSVVRELSKSILESGDELLTVTFEDLAPLLANESTQSILTTPQLITRWEQLTPELRSASLLPPNAGLLGHLSSFLFSKLLLPVKGTHPNGKDIESVIARVNADLSRGQLDSAVEEVVNLKGWTRRIADDWVVEVRKRLEIEFLLGVIQTESRLL